MRILFLHIGDIHIKDDRVINEERLDKLADTLNMYHFDEIIVIIAGDIAFSGQLEQYEIASKFIELLCEKIKNRKPSINKVNLICVPGNHDIDYHGKSITSKELQYIRDEDGYELFLDEEIQKMYCFYTFSSKHKCFNRFSGHREKPESMPGKLRSRRYERNGNIA